MEIIHPVYRARVQQLIDELKKFDNKGYVYMHCWVNVTAARLQEAVDNPCGTAACLAGKAGLMPVFHEQGFRWIPDVGFTIAPWDFFGPEVTYGVFQGEWARRKIHTPEQGVLVLEAFLRGEGNVEKISDEDRKSHTDRKRLWLWWRPDQETARAVQQLDPESKVFPVSNREHVDFKNGSEELRWCRIGEGGAS